MSSITQPVCLLVGAFNPLTFKVIIHMYDPTTIFLIVWDLFIVVLFLLLGFLPGEVPLAFVVKLAWWHWILLTFACLERFWFLHQIWTRVLLGRIFLVVRFFPFIALNTLCHSLLACRVSIEKSAENLMGVPLYVINICHFPPFNVLNLSLILLVWKALDFFIKSEWEFCWVEYS